MNSRALWQHNKAVSESYVLESFDPINFLDRYGLMVVVAPTGSGKTVFLTDLLARVHQHFYLILLLSRTAKLQTVYSFMEPSLVYDSFDETLLTDLWNERIEQYSSGLELKPTLILMDDILTEKKVHNSKILKELACGSRHLKISVIILSHGVTQLNALVRNNASWAVSFDLDRERERKNFINEYLSTESYRIGELLFKKTVQETKYQCIVVEVHKNGADVNTKVKKFVANSSPKKFKIKDPRVTETVRVINTAPRPPRSLLRRQ